MKLKYVFIEKYEKSTHIQMHYHNCFEIVFYYHTNGYTTWKHSDRGTADTADALIFTDKELGAYKYIEFSDNSVILIPPNTLHDEKHYTDSKLTAIGFSLSPEDKDIPLLHTAAPLHYHDDNGKIRDLIQKIEQVYSQRTPLYQKIIELLILSILMLLGQDKKVNDTDEQLRFTKAYIDEHFTAPIEVDILARQIGYSVDHFRILFKNYFGQNPKDYILDKRLELAKRLLSETDTPTGTIGGMCGFADPAQFNKFFKNKIGQTPLEYRSAAGRAYGNLFRKNG